MRLSHSNGSLLSHQVMVAQTFWQRFIGLMGRSALASDEVLWINRCSSVHGCFMRFPIDVVFLDASWRIVHIMSPLRPWCFSPIVRKSVSVIETQAGFAVQHGLQVGMQLLIDEPSIP